MPEPQRHGDEAGALPGRLREAARVGPEHVTALLVNALPAYGAALVEWPVKAEPIVLAVSGLIQDVGTHVGVLDLIAAAEKQPGHCALFDAGPPPLRAVVLARGARPPLVLLVWADFAQLPDCEALLREVPALVDRGLQPPEDRAAAPAPPPPSLIFPEGYVPGDSPAMTALYREMRVLLQGDLPVLIVGETGVGKESVARTLHGSSTRRAGPFVAVNCAAIPAELLEAEMFGISKGVATGVSERPGKFQLARGGTLFLDEIGEMPHGLQAKLLRALDEKEVHPVGGAPVSVDIRVISATNTNLLESMNTGRFRRDLYFRIAGFVLRVPLLRERKGHVPRLVEDFVRLCERETGKRVRGISARALRALSDYAWPGNVRELEHEVRRLVYLCPDNEVIDLPLLSPQILAGPGAAAPALPAGAVDGSLELAGNVAALERRLIGEAIARAGGNRTEAARLLGISRNGLALKMQRLGVSS